MLLALLSLTFALATQGQAADRAQLTQGVGELAADGGLPGVMAASGSPAFVVLTAGPDGSHVPLFVAAHIGKGRALAGGHDCFFGSSQLKHESNRRFFLNAIAWLSGKPVAQARVGFLGTAVPRDLFSELGLQQVELSRNVLASRLQDVDVICMGQSVLDGDPSDQAQVMRRVRSGLGLLIAGPGWGWLQVTPGRSLLTYQTGNCLLGDFGMHFTPEFAGAPFSAAGADEPELTTLGALDVIQQPSIPQAQIRTAITTLDEAIQVAPPDDASLRNQITALAKKESGGEPMPTLAKPITWTTPFSRLQARLDLQKWRSSPPDQVVKDPTADAFPGVVPTDAKRVTKQVQVDASVPGWHATGLYAAPGEVVRILIPEPATHGALSLRVGPHTDTLWHLDDWKRFPEISESVPLSKTATSVTTPFGGLIYVDVPADSHLGVFPVGIENAVAAPLYELGKTTPDEWTEAKLAKAPWADLVGKHVSISLPSSAIANLQDPEALMSFWDNVMFHCCELYSVPVGVRQERYCVDRQIGGGYMHSGYPIMTWEDVANTFADLSKLTAKGATWGFYHEMGHNFQQSDWTFDGTGEVTNNLFSVYGNETINGVTPDNFGLAHPALEPKAARDSLLKYLADGAKYDQWKSAPFLALTMYLELRIEFGWDPFKHVFAEYRRLRDDERPKTDEDKRDQWMVRFSREIHRNLGPFFVAWGVPTTEAARKSIDNLPVWMPKDWPGKSP